MRKSSRLSQKDKDTSKEEAKQAEAADNESVASNVINFKVSDAKGIIDRGIAAKKAQASEGRQKPVSFLQPIKTVDLNEDDPVPPVRDELGLMSPT